MLFVPQGTWLLRSASIEHRNKLLESPNASMLLRSLKLVHLKRRGMYLLRILISLSAASQKKSKCGAVRLVWWGA